MTRLVGVLVSAVLVAGLIAGCGSTGKVKESNTYVDAVNKAQNDFANTITQLSAKITPNSTPAEDHATLAAFQTAVDKVVADFRAIDPPSRVKQLHEQLIAAIADFGKEVASVSDLMSTKDANKIIEG